MGNIFFAALLLGVGSLALHLLQKSRRLPPLPPGPPADPLIGHLRTFPTKNPEIVLHECSKKYGDVMCFRLPGQTIITLDSHEAAVDLLEKRSGLYSCRPGILIYKLMGWIPVLTFLPYGTRFRRHRKILGPALTPPACIPFQPIQEENAHLLVDQLIKSKGDRFEHFLSKFTTAVIVKISTGYQVISDDDEYIKISTNVGQSFEEGGPPGTTAVDWFPLLQYMPSWFPGTYYAGIARKWNAAIRQLYDYPYEMVRNQMNQGTAQYSFLLKQLEAMADRTLSPEDVDDLKGAVAVLYAGGAETIWSALSSFFLAMLLYPECQKRAQEEFDCVVGQNRLPTFDDREALPYVTSIVHEILRWGPILPLGVPHRSTQDDIYRGMFIPKGSLVFSNITGMSLDEKMYKDPTTFNPARFLPASAGGNDEPLFWDVFGFGRRICPGRYLALETLWIAVATLLSTLNITKTTDENDKVIVPLVEFNTGIASHPKPFPCVITPKSRKAEQLVVEAVRLVS